MSNFKLNLGCGNDIKAGWINLDIAKLEGVDVVHNIEQLPLPFQDNYFNEILCQDVLEHIEYIPVLKDLNRILAKGGELKLRVPHFSCKANFIDPTHKKMFSIRTFDFFKNGGFNDRPYYFDFSFDKIKSRKLLFSKHFPFIHRYFLEFLFNRNTKLSDFYESTFLARIFPAENIEIIFVK